MFFSIRFLIFIILSIALIILLLFFIKSNQKYHLIIFSLLALIFIGFLGYWLMPTNVKNTIFSTMITNEPIENLHIEKVDGVNVLYNNNAKVSYTYVGDGKAPETYYPVYLKDLDDYYLLVFSIDSNKDYSHNRFYQEDYERSYFIDWIYFVDKKTGDMYYLRVYNTIGKTLALDKFENVNGIVIYHVLLDFELETSYCGLLFINTVEIGNGIFFSSEVTRFHYHGDDYSYIKKLLLTTKNQLIEVDSYGEIYYSSFSYTYNNNGFSMKRHTSSKILADEEYAKAGYITVVNDKIFYVNNNLEIYQFKYTGLDVYIEDVISLNTWEEQLT